MATATATATKHRIGSANRRAGDWLVELLVDVREDVSTQPTPQAIARIRQRLAAELKFPSVRAAA